VVVTVGAGLAPALVEVNPEGLLTHEYVIPGIAVEPIVP